MEGGSKTAISSKLATMKSLGKRTLGRMISLVVGVVSAVVG